MATRYNVSGYSMKELLIEPITAGRETNFIVHDQQGYLCRLGPLFLGSIYHRWTIAWTILPACLAWNVLMNT